MPRHSCDRFPPALRVFSLLLLATTFGAAPGSASGDRILGGGLTIREATLPDAEVVGEVAALPLAIRALAVLPPTGEDGERVVGIRTVDGVGLPYDQLVEIVDGQELALGQVTPALDGEVRDLAVDRRGRLWILVRPSGGPGTVLHRIDPHDGEVLATTAVDADFPAAIAPSPVGLWLLADDGALLEVDPTTGAAFRRRENALQGWFPFAADADSSGALWLSAELGAAATPGGAASPRISPPLFGLLRLDVTTGELLAITDSALPAGPLAIRRRCAETAGSGACLQGGRFRVDVAWRDFLGAEGVGAVVPGQSADSALFSFFSGANWELLVKVLDGCASSDRYWVFAAGTTNVGTTLTVTDLESGLSREYENPLGTAAAAITDTDAFPTCP